MLCMPNDIHGTGKDAFIAKSVNAGTTEITTDITIGSGLHYPKSLVDMEKEIKFSLVYRDMFQS